MAEQDTEMHREHSDLTCLLLFFFKYGKYAKMITRTTAIFSAIQDENIMIPT
jgi:hypothetical protein